MGVVREPGCGFVKLCFVGDKAAVVAKVGGFLGEIKGAMGRENVETLGPNLKRCYFLLFDLGPVRSDASGGRIQTDVSH